MNALERVPKWAWLASGGVVVGVVAFRAINNHGAQADKSAPTDATAPADYGQTGQGFTSGYVDVPYSSAPAPSNGNQVDLPSLISAIGGIQPAQPSLADILGALGPLIGGGAPQSSTTYAPPPPPDYAPVPPAPAPAPPYVAPPSPAPAPAAPANPCAGTKYPLSSDRGCYQVYCAPKGGSRAAGRWHLYASAPDQFIHGLPC